MVSLDSPAAADSKPARHRPRFHSLAIAEVRRETPEAVSVAFAVPDNLRADYAFVPGQYLSLRAIIEGKLVQRSYSICSGLDDGELRVAIKEVEGGRFSGFANRVLRAGEVLKVMTPMGRFGVAPDPAADRTYVGLACGSGITPVISILKSVLAREPKSRFVLLFGNRSAQGILFRDELEDLKDRYLERLSLAHVLSREVQDAPILNGRLDADKIGRLLPGLVPLDAIDHAFVCGPGAMIETSTATLIELGLPPERVQAERFTAADGSVAPALAPEAEPDRSAQTLAEIVLDGSRTRVPVAPGEAILDAGLRAGLDMPYSCRGGMCCTCRAKVIEGAVKMAVNYSLEPREIETGYTLTCQARPTTERVVVDYDHV